MATHQTEAWLSIEDINVNFSEARPVMKPKEAMDEANRCLYCYDAPCITACPTDIDVPSFIKKIASGNMKGSATTIMEANPAGASCARVCPTEELCEGACVLNDASTPIMIGDLQRYATDWAIKNEQVLFKKGEDTKQEIAIVGSGPAGLSAARELARFGHRVTIFEAAAEAGGLNTYGIVSFRLPKEIAAWEVQQVEALGVEIKTNVTVGKDIQIAALTEQYEAVIIAVGMGKVPMLGIEGEELTGVKDAIEFIKTTKSGSWEENLSGKKVAVIGAGNTAVDAATCSVRLGAESVKMVYRRTEKEMTAYDFEYEFAKQDGIEFQWLSAPVKIEENDRGEVQGLLVNKMKLEAPGDDGRQQVKAIEGAVEMLDVDIVIKAIGQERLHPLIEAFDVTHSDGVIQINEETYATSRDGVYAVGDVIFGQGQGEAMVVSAAQQGKKAAWAIHSQLTAGTRHSA